MSYSGPATLTRGDLEVPIGADLWIEHGEPSELGRWGGTIVPAPGAENALRRAWLANAEFRLVLPDGHDAYVIIPRLDIHIGETVELIGKNAPPVGL